MSDKDADRKQNVIPRQFKRKKAAPGSHVCGEQEWLNGIKHRDFQSTNDGEQNNDGHGRNDRSNRIVGKTRQRDRQSGYRQQDKVCDPKTSKKAPVHVIFRNYFQPFRIQDNKISGSK